ncbi:metallopeptidase TldD-related protein, partial [Vibrio campbellii]
SYTVARHKDALWTPEKVGRLAAEQTVNRLDPRRVPTGEYPVMFAADVATGLMGHLVMAISGGNLYRKASFLLDHLGEK